MSTNVVEQEEAGSEEKQVVLVTGAQGGIGSAVCTRLARDGWQVVATDIEPPAAGNGTYSLALDVADSAAWSEVVAGIIERFRRLDALVNVAGIVARGSIEETTNESCDHVIAVNQTGTFY